MEQHRDEKVIMTEEPKPTTMATTPSPSSESIKAPKEITPVRSFDDNMHKEPKYDAAVDEKDLGMKNSSSTDLDREDAAPVPKWKQLLKKYLWVFNLLLWMLMTG